MHAAGHCGFGSRSRNKHVGDAGSNAAKKAYIKAQEDKAGAKNVQAKDDKGKVKAAKGKQQLRQ